MVSRRRSKNFDELHDDESTEIGRQLERRGCRKRDRRQRDALRIRRSGPPRHQHYRVERVVLGRFFELFSCDFHNENNSLFTGIIQGEVQMEKLSSTRSRSQKC